MQNGIRRNEAERTKNDKRNTWRHFQIDNGPQQHLENNKTNNKTKQKTQSSVPNLARAFGQAAEESEGLGTLPPLGDSSQRSSEMANCTHRSSEIANRALEKSGIKMEERERGGKKRDTSKSIIASKEHLIKIKDTIFQNGIRKNEEDQQSNR
nr:hypothetical protein [Nostoc sp. ChiQUE02]MDZ8228822.1 hypothetical protein [Nostoc sp. ChiQUE02]